MALVSVIIPCYNVEKYIDRCLQSVTTQTIGIENLEIILVNDASTDGTLGILKEWEEIYPENIMVVTYEKNLRQGGARNIGIQYATSKYIGFIDADDYIGKDMYEILYNKANNDDFSMVCGSVKNVVLASDEIGFDKDDSEIKWEEYRYNFNGTFYEQEHYISGGHVGAGIYLREIIVNNNLWFPEQVSYEDNYWGG